MKLQARLQPSGHASQPKGGAPGCSLFRVWTAAGVTASPDRSGIPRFTPYCSCGTWGSTRRAIRPKARWASFATSSPGGRNSATHRFSRVRSSPASTVEFSRLVAISVRPAIGWSIGSSATNLKTEAGIARLRKVDDPRSTPPSASWKDSWSTRRPRVPPRRYQKPGCEERSISWSVACSGDCQPAGW